MKAKNNKVETDDLLTIGTGQIIRNKSINVPGVENKDTPSVFGTFISDEPMSLTQPIKEDKAPNLKVKINKKTEIIEPKSVESTEVLFYEIIYVDLEAKKEHTIYTSKSPRFWPGGTLEIKDAFGKLELRENVLGRKVVTESCRQDLNQTDLAIDIKKGVLVKAITRQDWMERGMEETKQLFNAKALNAYRDVAEEIKTEKPVVSVPKGDRPIRQSNVSLETPGNLPTVAEQMQQLLD